MDRSGNFFIGNSKFYDYDEEILEQKLEKWLVSEMFKFVLTMRIQFKKFQVLVLFIVTRDQSHQHFRTKKVLKVAQRLFHN